jgi:hypothetical protein
MTTSTLNNRAWNNTVDPAPARAAVRKAVSTLVDSRNAGRISDDLFQILVRNLLACKIEIEMEHAVYRKFDVYCHKIEQRFLAMGNRP